MNHYLIIQMKISLNGNIIFFKPSPDTGAAISSELLNYNNGNTTPVADDAKK